MGAKVAIRVDASRLMGTGHVMRCLTLAEVLRDSGHEIVFISRQLEGHLCDYIEAQGFYVARLPPPGDCGTGDWLGVPWEVDAKQTIEVLSDSPRPTDCLVVDNYVLDEHWEHMLRVATTRIMVIDDLANRRHDCDCLLDQNFYLDMPSRYDGLLPRHCQQFLGPAYVLLRSEFYQLKEQGHKRTGDIHRLLCFFGGADLTGETLKALHAILKLKRNDLQIDVVVGWTNPARQHVAELCATAPTFNYHCQTNRMAELCASADLALGAGGSASWERAILGLPSQVIITADNQKATTNAMANTGAIWLLGESAIVDSDTIAASLSEAFHAPSRLRKISETALAMMGMADPHSTQVLIEAMLD